MKRMTKEAYNRARYYIKSKARPLERALFEYYFENGSPDTVYSELTGFQNPDGGFGRALEPDVRTPASSALATGIGLHLLVELDCPSDHTLVRASVNYLMETFDPETHVWRVVPPETNEHPHAPWWHDENGSLAATFDDFLIIPRVLILASLHRYSSLVDAGWLDQLTEETVSCIEQVNLGDGGGSDLEYVIKLAEARHLPLKYAERLKDCVHKAIPLAVERDPNKWNTYCTTPLRIITSPDTLGAELIFNAVQAHLDYQIENQAADGSWKPTWTWGGVYPEHWEKAEAEWSGKLTLEALRILCAFGRIESL